MNKVEFKDSWRLEEIAKWGAESAAVSIPSLQRGLVWKPRQVELLWDSILRGFPIGSLTLSNSESASNSQFSLLDGQQRWNAISSGFFDKFEDIQNYRSIVWFDLHPDDYMDKDSTRTFLIRVTTLAHPWGFHTDDRCIRLNTEEKRRALEKLGLTGKTLCKEGISLRETYPVYAGYPVPLSWMLKARTDNAEIFIEDIISRIKENGSSVTISKDEIDEATLREWVGRYYSAFKSVREYRVPSILIDNTAKDQVEQSEMGADGKSEIEILFERIGTGGTQITQDELIYSAINAYWPVALKQENERLASKYMPPVLLVQLAFRLALSLSNGRLSSNLSVKNIRNIAASKDTEYNAVLDLYSTDGAKESSLETILKKVDGWLTCGNIPPVLRTGIARNSSDVFLLMMVIAKMERAENPYSEEDIKFFCATAYYLHWFVTDYKDKYKSDIVSSIYSKMIEEPGKSPRAIIMSVIAKFIAKNYLIVLQSPDMFRNLIKPEMDKKWRPSSNGNNTTSWWGLLSRVYDNREMLLYAQRCYMQENFSNYNPAMADMWAEENRPWDYDHIIPQAWIHVKGQWGLEYTGYCEAWKDCIGNLAAIPFEKNRAKNDSANWDEYTSNLESLLVDGIIEDYPKLFSKEKLTREGEQHYHFARKTWERLCRIYNEVYRLLAPIDLNNCQDRTIYSSGITARRERIERICSLLEEQGATTAVNYVWDHEETCLRESDWSRQWISAGILCKNKYYAAITMHLDNLDLDSTVEFGIRRKPGDKDTDKTIFPDERFTAFCEANDFQKPEPNLWWYAEKDLKVDETDESLAQKIFELSKKIEASKI